MILSADMAMGIGGEAAMRGLYRIIFSRYAFCALVIIIELGITAAVLIYASNTFAPLYAVAMALEAVTVLAVINEDANPEYKIPWIVIVLALPLFGFILYLAFHTRRMGRKEGRRMEESVREIRRAASYECKLGRLGEASISAATKALAILGDDPLAKVYADTGCEYFGSGREMFFRMLADLRSAREFIFLEYFIIEPGLMWNTVLDILRERVKAGVEVRVMYDDIGCMSKLPPKYDELLMREGIRCYRFSRVTPHISNVHNNRDHRKIAVIDGDIGYTGGINIADEYIGERARFGIWKDGGVRLAGSAVAGLCAIFLSGWEHASSHTGERLSYLRHRAIREREGFFIPFASGPKPIYKRPVGKRAFLNIINQSQTFIYISTPYLIIDYELTEALCTAAKRGVDVRIITPGIADKPLIKIMTKSSYPYLIESGVRIFEYTPGFIHEKMLLSDGEYGVVGTINFDYRSLVHHYENAVWIYGAPCLASMKEEYMKTLSLSREIGAREARLRPGEALFKNLVRIFAPLL